jgi:transcriptional regulator with XRE-family HTH domain
MFARTSSQLKATDNNLSSIDKSLGSRLRARRLLAGLSQEQLAQKLGIDIAEVVSYEVGTKRISALHLFELAHALGVPPKYFFGSSKEGEAEHAGDNTCPTGADNGFASPDQGVRLNRAFVGVRNPDLREAIIRLTTEMARSEDAR